MKLTDNELNELKYHYVDRVVDNMSTKDLVQYVFDDMLRHTETIPEVEFLEDDELCKIWNIIEIAMNREGYDVSNAELSMRLYDNELEENIEHDMENLL